MILPNGAYFDVRSLPRVAKVNVFFLNVLNVWFLTPPKNEGVEGCTADQSGRSELLQPPLPHRRPVRVGPPDGPEALPLFHRERVWPNHVYLRVYLRHNSTLKVPD